MWDPLATFSLQNNCYRFTDNDKMRENIDGFLVLDPVMSNWKEDCTLKPVRESTPAVENFGNKLGIIIMKLHYLLNLP